MKIMKCIRNSLGSLRVSLGQYPNLKTDDRKFLEKIILPYFSNISSIKNILFIGCEWYTKKYELFFAEKNYYTIDYDTKKNKYGSNTHITDAIQNIRKYFNESSLDLIICNGILGWGLNDQTEAEKTFLDFYQCLTKDGIVILGWNDIPKHRPFLPEESNLAELFSPYIFPPIEHWRYDTNTKSRHIYDFYYKKN